MITTKIPLFNYTQVTISLVLKSFRVTFVQGSSSRPSHFRRPYQPPDHVHRTPQSREDLEVAVICTLLIEYDAICLAFDKFWDEEGDVYGKARNDSNRYTTGRIGRVDVVLAHYTALRLVVLAGICAGVPSQEKENDILLGDVVISETVIQYDFGRQYPGEFSTKVSIADGLGRADASIRTQVEAFESDHERDRLINRAANVLTEIHDKGKKKRRPVDYSCPHPSTDLLFEFSYLHRHQGSSDCGCSTTQACNVAVATACEELNCGASYFVHRPRLERLVSNQDDAAFAELEIFVGCIGSGDTVMKSGERRDKMAKKHGIIAFEIEGAGAWDGAPCVVVKGVCDYADSHKNKKWQRLAAATAGSVTKAILAGYMQTDKKLHERGGSGQIEASSPPSSRHGGNVYGSITAKHVVAGGDFSGNNQTFTFS
ncbi:hypothetical protein M9X92_009043 [Pyricularia oryzae]|nr:hypothetical protein M9X92_009043 [Pyricularia oryzae]